MVPGTLVALVKPGRVVAVRRAPGGPDVARLSSRTEFGSPRTLAVTGTARALRVITTELPNGRTGWVDGHGALRLSRTTLSLDVDLSTRVLRVRAGKRLLRTMRVGIGAPGTSTPTGRFAITDKLRGSTGYRRAFRIGNVDEWGHADVNDLVDAGRWAAAQPGTDGRLAIHGSSTAGAVSTGCLHAAEADLRYLMARVPLGTQITIHP